MNVDTGEIIRRKELKLDKEELKQFRKVREDLEEEALKALGSEDKVTIDLKANTPLAKWAKQERKKDKSKDKKKRKQARKSRQRNRK